MYAPWSTPAGSAGVASTGAGANVGVTTGAATVATGVPDEPIGEKVAGIVAGCAYTAGGATAVTAGATGATGGIGETTGDVSAPAAGLRGVPAATATPAVAENGAGEAAELRLMLANPSTGPAGAAPYDAGGASGLAV